jgi:DNA-binding NtrC family response regulator
MESPYRTDRGHALEGAHLLVVEDEFIIMLELESLLLEAGAATVRLCGTVDQAMRYLESERDSIEAAILDVRVGRAEVAPVARMLDRRGIPFVFYTGQTETDPVRDEWPDCVVLQKPAPSWMITDTVARLVRGQSATKTAG